MTRTAIRKAFEKLDSAQQAEMLGELAVSLAKSLAAVDREDRRVFEERRREESRASHLVDVKARLLGKKKRQTQQK